MEAMLKTNTRTAIEKKTVIKALRNEYGFAPRPSDITLLEGSVDRTYIHFRIGNNYYSFRSHVMHGSYDSTWGVWCGKGTITRTDERGKDEV